MKKFSITVLRNSAFGMVAQLTIKALSFAFSVLVVRNLGAEAFGQYAAVMAFGALFAFISDLGLGVYSVREVARWRDLPDGPAQANALYANVLTLRLALSLLAALLVTLTAWLSGRPLVMVGAIALNACGLILYAVQGTSEAVLAGFERLDLSAGAKVVNQLAFVVVGAAALFWGFGYYGLILATLLGVALMTFVCWRGVHALGVRAAGVQAQRWPALLRASLPFGVIGFALGLSYKFDSVLLNIFRSDAETGYYNAAYNLIFSAAIISNVFNTALYPSLTRRAVTEPESLPRVYERALRYMLLIALPIAVGGWTLADQLIPFLFGADYAPAVPAFKIVIWVLPLMFASEFLGYVVLISGKEARAARAVLVSTGLNVAANLLLVPRFGFIGAAVMTVLTEAVLVGQYVWTLRPVMQKINWGNSLLRPLLAVFLMGGLVLLVHSLLPLLASVAVGGVTYGLLLLALGVIGMDDLRFVQNIRSASKAAIG
ncbi:MAG: flippase [Chloroflexi bacterium]|nr:flippase [Chloroflexota bacterium]